MCPGCRLEALDGLLISAGAVKRRPAHARRPSAKSVRRRGTTGAAGPCRGGSRPVTHSSTARWRPSLDLRCSRSARAWPCRSGGRRPRLPPRSGPRPESARDTHHGVGVPQALANSAAACCHWPRCTKLYPWLRCASRRICGSCGLSFKAASYSRTAFSGQRNPASARAWRTCSRGSSGGGEPSISSLASR